MRRLLIKALLNTALYLDQNNDIHDLLLKREGAIARTQFTEAYISLMGAKRGYSVNTDVLVISIGEHTCSIKADKDRFDIDKSWLVDIF
jgi:hypothetical protein